MKNAMVGSAIASKAVASTLPTAGMVTDDSVWKNVRAEIEAETKNSVLTDEMQLLLEEYQGKPSGVREVIRLSYLSIAPEKNRALDEFWLDQGSVQSEPALLRAVLQHRGLAQDQAQTAEELIEKWMLLACHKPGSYDNGQC